MKFLKKLSSVEVVRRETDLKIAQDACQYPVLLNPPLLPDKHQLISRRQWLNQLKEWRKLIFTN